MIDLEQRILAHTHKEGDHLIWDGFMLKNRYPVYSYCDETGGGKTVRVARYLYGKTGQLHGNLVSTCKVPRCIEPSHHDHFTTVREKKTRTRRAKAIRHYRVKLVEDLAQQGYKRREIADNLGLPYSTVSRIVQKTVSAAEA